MILDAGDHEREKLIVHGTLCGLVAICAAYNIAAWVKRGDRHLALNAIIYSAGVALEAYQTAQHVKAALR